MLIQYTGHCTRRIIGALEWSRDTPCVEIADAGLALNLLTQDDFAVARDEPLANLPGVGPQRVAELTLAGIATMDDLRALTEADIERVAASLGASKDQVRSWATIARSTITLVESVPELSGVNTPREENKDYIVIKKASRRKAKQ